VKKRIYIPGNLDECFVELNRLLPEDEIEKMKMGSEDEMVNYHFGIGMWMRNNWGLWGGSHLKEWFNEKGIYHPDDMSGIILESYWRYLNDRPIELKQQIAHYEEYWRIHSQPKERDCPTCGNKMESHFSGKGFDPFHPNEWVQIYQCPKEHYWLYYYSRGFYGPEKYETEQSWDSLVGVWKLRISKELME
jgi:hypothetical protein